MTHCFEDPWLSSHFADCHVVVGADTSIEDSGTIRDVDFESVEDQQIAKLKEMACGHSRIPESAAQTFCAMSFLSLGK